MESEHEMVWRYQKYFEKWDEVSAVRSKPNIYRLAQDQLNVDLKNKKWFLPSVLPILSHPLLKSIDQDQEQFLLEADFTKNNLYLKSVLNYLENLPNLEVTLEAISGSM